LGAAAFEAPASAGAGRSIHAPGRHHKATARHGLKSSNALAKRAVAYHNFQPKPVENCLAPMILPTMILPTKSALGMVGGR
jgi:hypothetical protein